MRDLIVPKNHFVFGSVGDGEGFRYLALDIFTKYVCIGKEENGVINLEKKLTPGNYVSLLKNADMPEGALIPDYKNNSVLAVIKGINFENAIPKNFPVE